MKSWPWIALLLLVGLFFAPAQAQSADSPDVVISAADFCGKLPPPAVLCPQTRLNQCLCYLSDTQVENETFTYEASEGAEAPLTRPKLKRLLPPIDYPQATSVVLPSLIERPPA